MKNISIEKTKLLRSLFISKIEFDWPNKWQKTHGDSFIFSLLKSQNAFLEDLLLDIEKVLKTKIGLENTSQILISKDNLRRILNQSEPTSWQEKTKNTLAYYLGYEGWIDFVNNSKEVEKVDSITNENRQSTITKKIQSFFKYLVLTIFILFLIFKVCSFYINYENKNANLNIISSIKDTYPSSVSIISQIPWQFYSKYSIKIEHELFEFFDPNSEYEISTQNQISNFLFFTPGLKKISLKKNDSEIKSYSHLVSTNDEWYGCARIKSHEKSNLTEANTFTAWYGDYSPFRNVYNNYLTTPNIWAEAKKLTKNLGYLTFPKDYLSKNKNYFNRVAFLKAENFNIDLNVATLSFKAKKEKATNEDCLSFMLQLTDEKFQSFEFYSATNCKLNANISFSMQSKSKSFNLIYFANNSLNRILDDNEWHFIKIMFANSEMQIFVDQKNILYKKNIPIGFAKLREIILVFEGNGCIDDFNLENTLTKQVIFSNHF